MAVLPIPAGYQTVTPYLMVKGVARFLDFVAQAFDAEERERLATPDGTVLHAEVKVGTSVIMMGEAQSDWPTMPCALYLYVEDCGALFKKAVAAGADVVQEPTDQFYGDRSAGVRDEWGNLWFVATRVEDLSKEELAKRFAEARG